MPSQFLGLNTGLSGLSYFQSALNTTAHNISNANTEGYSRQQILASAANPVSYKQPYGMMGTGVKGESIDRLRSEFYDNKYWNANSKYNRYQAQYDNLSMMEKYMNEISGDAGYSKWLSQLSQALQDLADDPSNDTTRISFSLTADSYTDVINELSENFQRTQTSINDEIELVVSEINSLANQIYELTQQIINVELKGGNANDLRDKRGVCIDKLSQYVDVEVEERSIMFGTGKDAVPSKGETLSVRINGMILVDELEVNELMVVPRAQNINLTDVEGLVDIAWKCADGTAGDDFNVLNTEGKLRGLFDVRDGNNGENFKGKLAACSESPSTISVKVDSPIHINNLNIPAQGTITVAGKQYMYDGWKADYDEDGYLTNFVFENMTMINEKGVEVAAKFPSVVNGNAVSFGKSNVVKGIPYYMARLNELVRTFSKYMNDLTTSGVDSNGDPGLDMFTALDPYGKDYSFVGAMTGSGVVSSKDSTYYKLTALNWELNSQWKNDADKIVVSMKEDVEQGNVEYRPIVDKMIYGITDQTMFSQGTISQFMHSITTTLAVDIAKSKVFSENHDDVRYTIDNQRSSVSGVDTNEETSNLTKFQNLYKLASQVISVLNEVYDKLINDTGV